VGNSVSNIRQLAGLSLRYGRLRGMAAGDPKADLHRYLQAAREALLWKLAGLSDYDIRRPLTPTGTNLLGLVKHLAGVELWYFGDGFGRPPGERPWSEDDARNNADMWATADESRDQIVGAYRRAWAHADETIEALGLDAVGHVPWWPSDRNEPTLHLVLVHVLAETNRHAGHADIVRELIDGAAGLEAGDDNLRPGDQAWWERYRSQLERVAEQAGQRPGA
jgi:Protein of unknown function (DUF664)